jgi:hypothetical protein
MCVCVCVIVCVSVCGAHALAYVPPISEFFERNRPSQGQYKHFSTEGQFDTAHFNSLQTEIILW